jgi:hypothetical protein
MYKSQGLANRFHANRTAARLTFLFVEVHHARGAGRLAGKYCTRNRRRGYQ